MKEPVQYSQLVSVIHSLYQALHSSEVGWRFTVLTLEEDLVLPRIRSS